MEPSGPAGLRCFRTLDGEKQPGAQNSRLVRRTARDNPDFSDDDDAADPEEVAEWVTDVLLATCEEAAEAGLCDFQKFLDALDAGDILEEIEDRPRLRRPSSVPSRLSQLSHRHDADLPSKLELRRNADQSRRNSMSAGDLPGRLSMSEAVAGRNSMSDMSRSISVSEGTGRNSMSGPWTPPRARRGTSPRITSPLSPSNENLENTVSPMAAKKRASRPSSGLSERMQMQVATSLKNSENVNLENRPKSRDSLLDSTPTHRRSSILDPTGGLVLALSPTV